MVVSGHAGISNNLNVLLVDNKLDANDLQARLSQKNTSLTPLMVLQARSLAGAHACLVEQDIDVVLFGLDLTPEKELMALEQLLTWTEVPVVVLAGAEKEDISLERIQLGVADCVVRPVIDYAQLARTLRFAIMRKQAALAHGEHPPMDALTGLYNRATFMDRLREALTRTSGGHGRVGVIAVGIDRFKVINDTFGHEMGDLLLKQVAERLKHDIRDVDTVARLGSDEYAIILAGALSEATLRGVADRLLISFQQPFFLLDDEVFISVSIGMSVVVPQNCQSDVLFQQADLAMHQVKRMGRKHYLFFEEGMNTGCRERMSLEGQLHTVLKKRELSLYYQPQINTRNGDIVGIEALLRWHHPEKGLIPPSVAIPLLEESGLIVSVGEWILRTACKQRKRWENQGLLPADCTVAVNLSARQFKGNDIAAMVETILDEMNLAPSLLDLEITESILMEDTDRTRDLLNRLKVMGVHISLDDFGTEYSSLSYLKSFPIDRLKIDKSFVQNIQNNPQDAAITSAIVNLARDLNLKVVVEGVETLESLTFLQALGSDIVQGYYFCHPMPTDQFERWLNENQAPVKNRFTLC